MTTESSWIYTELRKSVQTGLVSSMAGHGQDSSEKEVTLEDRKDGSRGKPAPRSSMIVLISY